jgi:hypothetical protein
LAEVEGLLSLIDEEDEAGPGADAAAYPATLALIPAFKTLDRDAAFDASVEAFIDGVRAGARQARLNRSPNTC